MTTFIDASKADEAAVGELLGRTPVGRFAVRARRLDGRPVVIENEPHLRDGTPMPTLYWLVDRELREAVSRVEGEGGVHRYESMVCAAELQATHDNYARERGAATVQVERVQPTGGVGGTRTGVKCLHAHVAYFLIGGEDPVGSLVAHELTLPEIQLENPR